MSLNVLVVDDSTVMRRMVIRTLGMCGVPIAEVHEAGNGAEGLAALDDGWFDIALVDINMPVMDGATLIDRIRARPDTADLPIVVVSTESSQTRIHELEAKGVSFVHKPFAAETLGALIRDVTGVEDGEFGEPGEQHDGRDGTPEPGSAAQGAVPGDGFDF